MVMLKFALRLATKDLLLFKRDEGGLTLAFVLPIALAVIFTIVLGSIGSDDEGGIPKQTLRIADAGGSASSRSLLDALRSRNLATVETTDKDGRPFTRESLHEAVKTGRFPLGVAIDAGFGEALAEGRMLGLEVLRDTGREMEPAQ
jgi:hypothetical protein